MFGRYRYSKIERQIYHIAEKSDIPLFSGMSFVSQGIQVAQHSMWGHAAVYVGDHKIVEAVQSGVKENPLNNYFDNKTIIQIRRIKDITLNQVQLMMQKIFVGPDKLINRKYDYAQVFGALLHILTVGWIAKNAFDSPDAEICSEVVDECAKQANIVLCPGLANIRDVYPKDIVLSKLTYCILYLNPRTGNFVTDPEVLLRYDSWFCQNNDGDWKI